MVSAQGQEDQHAQYDRADPPGAHGRRARPGDSGQPGAPGDHRGRPGQLGGGGGRGPGAGAELPLTFGQLGQGPFLSSQGHQFLAAGEGGENPRADGGPCGRQGGCLPAGARSSGRPMVSGTKRK